MCLTLPEAMAQFDGRVVIVTCGTSGIGRAAALAFAREAYGWKPTGEGTCSP
jgi:NAD(P)-dependent dehydrogenase (short-subunit alcohol dehydrogenase family)